MSSGAGTFEILARAGQVSYTVDHRIVYRGAAYYAGPANLLVSGDGSGYDPTGLGSMLVDRILIDTTPTMSVLTTVPLPGSAPLPAGAVALVALGAWRTAPRRTVRYAGMIPGAPYQYGTSSAMHR